MPTEHSSRTAWRWAIHASMQRHTVFLPWGVLLLAGLVVAFAPLPMRASGVPETHVFRLEASQFSYSPSELNVNPGDTVTIQLTSVDAVHGLYLDGYGVSMQVDPGQTSSLTFVADRPGSFRFRCNVTCGPLHPFLIGRFKVGADTFLYRSVGITSLAALGVFISFRRSSAGGIIV